MRRTQFGFKQKRGSIPAKTIGAIDLGTNSCRLLIGAVRGDTIEIIDSFSRVVRLGEGLEKTGALSEAAMDRAFEALLGCKHLLDYHGVRYIRAVTTEACRRADNSDIFIEKVKRELGICFEVISHEEEAELALWGCSSVITDRTSYALTFDIGGGSTEVMWIETNLISKDKSLRPPIIDWISLPLGVVTLSEIYGSHVADERSYTEIQRRVHEELEKFSLRNDIKQHVDNRDVQLIGTSGTVTTIGAIFLDLERYDRSRIDGLDMPLPEARKICRNIFSMNELERLNHSCIGYGRTDLVIVGAAILEGILNTWSVPSIRVADRGVREGILQSLLKEITKSLNQAKV